MAYTCDGGGGEGGGQASTWYHTFRNWISNRIDMRGVGVSVI